MKKLLLALIFAALAPAVAYGQCEGGTTGGNPGTPGSRSCLSAGVYNSSPPTATSGQQVGLQTDANGNLKVVSSGSGTSPNPVVANITDRSGTITLGGTSQQLAAANTSRKRLIVENPCAATEDIFIDFGTAATTTAGVDLAPCGSYDSGGGPVSGQAVNIIAATTSHAFVAKEQ